MQSQKYPIIYSSRERINETQNYPGIWFFMIHESVDGFWRKITCKYWRYKQQSDFPDKLTCLRGELFFYFLNFLHK